MTRAGAAGRQAIDWSEVRRRLAHALALIEANEVPPERSRQLLAERARRLAQEPASSAPARETLQVLTFALGPERYAIEARYVREVLRLVDFTPVPGAGELVFGVTNLRGEVLCIVDLRRLLGLRPESLHDLSRLIVLGTDAPQFGLLADSADEIASLHADALRASPAAVGVERAHLRGITDDALIVLDGAALLAEPRLFVEQSEDVG